MSKLNQIGSSIKVYSLWVIVFWLLKLLSVDISVNLNLLSIFALILNTGYISFIYRDSSRIQNAILVILTGFLASSEILNISRQVSDVSFLLVCLQIALMMRHKMPNRLSITDMNKISKYNVSLSNLLESLDRSERGALSILAASSLLYAYTNIGLLSKIGLSEFIPIYVEFGRTVLPILELGVLAYCLNLFIQFLRARNGKVKSQYMLEYLGRHKLALGAIIIFYSALRLPSLNFVQAFPDTYFMPLVSENMLHDGFFTLKEQVRPYLGLNLYSSGGRWYPRGWVYTLTQALSMKTFGLNDFAFRLPSLIFGMVSTVAAYLIGKERDASLAYIFSGLMIFSGWSIAFSTYVRSYVAYIALLLLSVYFAIRFVKGKSKLWLPIVSISLLIHSHLQAVLPASILILIIFAYRFTDLDYEKILGFLNAVLVLIIGFMVFFRPFDQTISGFVQFADYHVGAEIWRTLWGLVLIGGYKASDDLIGITTIPVFLIPWISLPYLSQLMDRILLPRYTAAFYPLFLLLAGFLIVDLARILSDRISVFERDHLITLFTLAVVLVSVGGFIIPGNSYSKTDIWPDDYNAQINSMDSRQSNTVLVDKKGVKILSDNIDENKRYFVLGVDGKPFYWYYNINERYSRENVDPFWLANYAKLDDWSYNSSRMDSVPKDLKIYKKENALFNLHSGVPVVSSREDIKMLKEQYDQGFLILSRDYAARASKALNYFDQENKIYESDKLEIYNVK